ncbi:RNA pyrophosphohydrolase [Saccharibacter floricola]|uniref:RNA pyrophosphohydrolase n=1 Tax=Saccharibacter floricola DSM 15669 TaxID=1123227 RepID=A0ABQ0NXJ4_9PROT|nr:RNA pyrophosphohydrolase [Saccharibacter floricola]GBQ05628.1 dinucleoside polyphosphate hydrolase [Saccharibacter floricola DSM 15669]
MTTPTDLPYRPNVGIALFNAEGKLFFAQRADLPGEVWQCPQGGIDDGETPHQAAQREMMEEIGTSKAVLLGEREEWYAYDLPAALIGKALGGRYRGQRQKWFVFGYTGQDSDIRLDGQDPAEFSTWRWVSPEEISQGVYDLGFKGDLYKTVLPDLIAVFQDAPKDWIRTSRA